MGRPDRRRRRYRLCVVGHLESWTDLSVYTNNSMLKLSIEVMLGLSKAEDLPEWNMGLDLTNFISTK